MVAHNHHEHNRSEKTPIRPSTEKFKPELPLAQVERLSYAREQASFDPKQLAVMIYGSKQELETSAAAFARVEKALGTDDMSKLPSTYSDMDRQEQFLEGLKAGKICFEDGFKYNHDVFDHTTHLFALGNSNPLGLTMFLFTPYLKLVGTPEQVERWLTLADQGKITGSYTQTELGHGTFVGGIETTATLDKDTDEFVIHTPSESAIKYWPGAIGFTSSHTVLMARLIVEGKDHGVHPFMVQLRSLVDFKPMPGIELGDIGLKMSYNGTDNGYAIFNEVRIPRTNMLMKHATVSSDGKYTAVPLREKLVYGGMLNGRSIMIRHAAFQLAQALTIATRYSIVRTQGHKLSTSSNPVESSIISYTHQQHRLLSHISRAYIILFAWQAANNVYSTIPAMQAAGNHSKLSYTHMLMCGLKAWATQTASDGAEDCRKMCGGHGYLAISGLAEIVSAVVATCTFEGENFVMWGQVSRYLMKGLDAVAIPADLAYIDAFCSGEKRCNGMGKEFREYGLLLEIFKQRAAKCISAAHKLVKGAESRGMGREQAENKYGLELLVASRAHIEVFILSSAISQLAALPAETPDSIKTVLYRLVSLFGLTTISSPFSPFNASFVDNGYLSVLQLHEMRCQTEDLVQELLPEVVALTDAWSFSDATLRSAIGCKDGDAYHRIMSWTRQLPINVEAKKSGDVFQAGWEGYIRPMMKGVSQFRAKL